MIILFDFDGTLVNQNREQAFQALLESISPTHIKRKYHRKCPSKLANCLYKEDMNLCTHEIYDRRYLFRLFAQKFPGKTTEHLCKIFWEKVYKSQRAYRNAKTVLEYLQKDNTIVCATDTDGFGGNKLMRIVDSKLGLGHFFDKIFIGSEKPVKKSGKTGKWIRYGKKMPAKGKREYIEAILKYLRKTNHKNQCVMIGDKASSDLLPAASVGISTILVRNKEYKGKWPVVRSLSNLKKTLDLLHASVFVSYSRKDTRKVERIEKALKGTNTRFWRDTRNIAEGSRFVPRITDAIRSQKAVLILLTENSVRSRWVQFEIGQAVYYEIVKKKPVFVVLGGRVKNSDIPSSLRGLNYFDIRGRKFDREIARLRRAINDVDGCNGTLGLSDC